MGSGPFLFRVEIATTSKVPVTTSVALVTSSFLLLLLRHLLLEAFQKLASGILPTSDPSSILPIATSDCNHDRPSRRSVDLTIRHGGAQIAGAALPLTIDLAPNIPGLKGYWNVLDLHRPQTHGSGRSPVSSTL